jgi:hypothetical protein
MDGGSAFPPKTLPSTYQTARRYNPDHYVMILISGDIVPGCTAYECSVTLTDQHNRADPLFSATICFGCLYQPSSGKHQVT